jgi:hypothetical protein
MILPNAAEALVPQEKITGYLLSETHRDGRQKTAFFKLFGFTAESWEVLAVALRRHAVENAVVRIEDSPFGTRYVIEGSLATPDGRSTHLRSVWFIETRAAIPRLATACPLPPPGGGSDAS